MAAARLAAWPAPAKLNRFLHITGRRSDGYHNLQTVFQFITFCDYLWFEIRSDARISRADDIPGFSAEQDLSVRAAKLLQRHAGTALGVNIRLQKNLPIGGGLGGGSSDAATTLLALNYYWNTGLSVRELAALGLDLGADVPVFIHGQAAWAEGIGEEMTPVLLKEPWFVVLIPPCQVSTATIFNDPDLTRDSKPIKMRALTGDALNKLCERNGNDCEAVVLKRYPEVAAAFDWLSHYALARLTGTGACVFAAFDGQRQAEEVLAEKPDTLAGFVSHGRNVSPLRERLQREKMDVGRYDGP